MRGINAILSEGFIDIGCSVRIDDQARGDGICCVDIGRRGRWRLRHWSKHSHGGRSFASEKRNTELLRGAVGSCTIFRSQFHQFAEESQSIYLASVRKSASEFLTETAEFRSSSMRVNRFETTRAS